LTNFCRTVAHILNFVAFYISNTSHNISSNYGLNSSNENCFWFALKASHNIEANICRHINCVDVETSTIKPKIFSFFCFFIYFKSLLLLYAWHALSSGALYASVSTMTALIIPCLVYLINTFPSKLLASETTSCRKYFRSNLFSYLISFSLKLLFLTCNHFTVPLCNNLSSNWDYFSKLSGLSLFSSIIN